MDSEGLNLLDLVNKNMDPHQICTIIDVCPSNIVFKSVCLQIILRLKIKILF
jgi:hypothetical protein